jgi:hypothetical protein
MTASKQVPFASRAKKAAKSSYTAESGLVAECCRGMAENSNSGVAEAACRSQFFAARRPEAAEIFSAAPPDCSPIAG